MISAIAPVVPFIYMEIVLEAMIKGMGLQGFSSVNYLAEYVIRISIVLVAVPQIGFAGIALSYYASNIFGNIMRLVKLLRYTGVRFRVFSMVVSPVMYAFFTMSAVELLFRVVYAAADTVVSMVIFFIIWLILYGGVYILSHILTSVEKMEKTVVQN